MKRWVPIAVNTVAFNALWAVIVLGAARPWWWVGPALVGLSAAAQLMIFSPRPAREAAVIAGGAMIGVGLDSAGAALGMYRYAGGSAGEFLAVFTALWVNFGTTLRPGLSWMWRRPLVAAAFGGIGGVFSYWAAARIGAVRFDEHGWSGLWWVAAQFAVAVPAWMLAADAALSAPAGTGPRPTATGGTR